MSMAVLRLSTFLLASALGLVAFPTWTLAYGWALERGAKNDLQTVLAEPVVEEPTTAYEQTRQVAKLYNRRIKPGEPIGRLRIGEIDLDAVVSEGSRKLEADGFDWTLKSGPSHIYGTPLPGQGSNTVIAGHRTPYTHPFWSLDEVGEGDELVVELPYGTFRYEVDETEVVEPGDIDIAADHGYEELTLVTCTPRFSEENRLIVHARFVQYEPRGPKGDA